MRGSPGEKDERLNLIASVPLILTDILTLKYRESMKTPGFETSVNSVDYAKYKPFLSNFPGVRVVNKQWCGQVLEDMHRSVCTDLNLSVQLPSVEVDDYVNGQVMESVILLDRYLWKPMVSSEFEISSTSGTFWDVA